MLSLRSSRSFFVACPAGLLLKDPAGKFLAGQWNLERKRPNWSIHWTYGVAIHHCNWDTPDRY